MIHKGIDEVNALCFLERSLLFADVLFTSDEEGGDKIAEVSVIDVIARILAAFSLYFFINSRASSRSLILYH